MDEPGKYDDECTMARISAQASGAVLIIIGGRLGHGFSAQLSPADGLRMPAMLRDLADQIEQQVAKEFN